MSSTSNFCRNVAGKAAILYVLTWLALSFTAHANTATKPFTIEINALGKLDVEFAQTSAVKSVDIASSIARVTVLPGSAQRLIAPFDSQQVDYLVVDGEKVSQGQRLAKLSGSEVHHFRDSLAAKKAVFELAESRYQKNKPLVTAKSISQDKWLTISQQFFEAKLAWGHLNHFAEMFEPHSNDDMGYLLAPVDGVFQLPHSESGEQSSMGDVLLGSVTNEQAIRLTTLVDNTIARQVTLLSTPLCTVPVERTEKVANRYLVRLWSSPLPQNCGYQLGEELSLNASMNEQGLRVPSESIFYIDGKAALLKKQAEQLVVVFVSIIGDTNEGDIVIASQSNLLNAQVLSTSVSAVQGMLLGLGGVE